MSRLTWTERDYHGGADRGVVYSRNGSVEAWNGLISVTEKLTDIRTRVRYRDGEKVLNHRAEDTFAATIECFTYPESVANPRQPFDLSYRLIRGRAHEIHLVYNAYPQIGGGNYTQNEITPFQIGISTRPVDIPPKPGEPSIFAPTAHLILDTRMMSAEGIEEMETVLYGADDFEPIMPAPEQVLGMFEANPNYKVIDNGDGTFTLEAPDEVFEFFEEDRFSADWPTAVYLNADTYTVRNW